LTEESRVYNVRIEREMDHPNYNTQHFGLYEKEVGMYFLLFGLDTTMFDKIIPDGDLTPNSKSTHQSCQSMMAMLE